MIEINREQIELFQNYAKNQFLKQTLQELIAQGMLNLTDDERVNLIEELIDVAERTHICTEFWVFEFIKCAIRDVDMEAWSSISLWASSPHIHESFKVKRYQSLLNVDLQRSSAS